MEEYQKLKDALCLLYTEYTDCKENYSQNSSEKKSFCNDLFDRSISLIEPRLIVDEGFPNDPGNILEVQVRIEYFEGYTNPEFDFLQYSLSRYGEKNYEDGWGLAAIRLVAEEVASRVFSINDVVEETPISISTKDLVKKIANLIDAQIPKKMFGFVKWAQIKFLFMNYENASTYRTHYRYNIESEWVSIVLDGSCNEELFEQLYNYWRFNNLENEDKWSAVSFILNKNSLEYEKTYTFGDPGLFDLPKIIK